LRTLGVDLPGFGRTPAPDELLTPAVLAAPVVELARSLEKPPVVLGFSLGGRVAIEAALTAPEAFRGAVLVAPYLPWRRYRWAFPLGQLLSPRLAERVPLQLAWPLLRRGAHALERNEKIEDDWLARASVRVMYYLSCPATRAAFVSASRGLALDRAFGPTGTWTRLADLLVPAAFVWGGRDRLIPAHHAERVADLLPNAHHLVVPCSGHFVHGRHFRCFEGAMVTGVARVLAAPEAREHLPRRHRIEALACIAEDVPRAARNAAPSRGDG
jgi:pimeloyl-ACP methyl ester carboxylesterase